LVDCPYITHPDHRRSIAKPYMKKELNREAQNAGSVAWVDISFGDC
jgi:hypothetical protein